MLLEVLVLVVGLLVAVGLIVLLERKLDEAYAVPKAEPNPAPAAAPKAAAKPAPAGGSRRGVWGDAGVLANTTPFMA